MAFYFQKGDHYIFEKDFSVESPELFRFTKAYISFQPFDDSEISIILKTNLFHFFISGTLVIDRIKFYGNDMFMKDNNLLCNSTVSKICCLNIFHDILSEECLNQKKFEYNPNDFASGMFILEYIPEVKEFPKILIRNSTFTNFILINVDRGFQTLFNIKNGELQLENVTLFENSFLFGFLNGKGQNGLIDSYYSDAYKDFTAKELNITIKNLNVIDLNQYNHAFIFIENIDINFQMENTIFYNIRNTVGLITSNIKVKDIFIINDLKFIHIYNFTLIYASSLIGLMQMISLSFDDLQSDYILIKIDLTQNLYLKNISFFKIFHPTHMDEPIIFSENSNILLNSIFFKDGTIFRFIDSYDTNIYLKNCSMTNLNFSIVLILFRKTKEIIFEEVHFFNVYGLLSFFYSIETIFCSLLNVIIENCLIQNIFFFELKFFICQNSIMKLNFISNFLESYVFIKDIFISFLIFERNTIEKFFFKNNDMDDSKFLITHSVLERNDCLNFCFIETLTGLAEFINFLCIKNYFLNSNKYSYAFDFEIKSKILINNSYFEDNGVITKKGYYIVATDNCMFLIWYITSIIFDNVILVISKSVELASGFIASSPLGDSLKITNCNFLIISKNPSFEYKGMILDSPKEIIFANNSFFNLVCGTKTLSHSNGAIFLSSSASFRFSKNKNVLNMYNCSFINCSCYNGGSLAVISTAFVQMEYCTFKNSSSIFKGGAVFSVANPEIYISNFKVEHSIGEQGGIIFLQDSKNIFIFNITLTHSYTSKRGSVYLAFITKITIDSGYIFDSTANGEGGCYYIYEASVNITNFYILNTSASEGGVFFFQGKSNLYLINSIMITCMNRKGGSLRVLNGDELYMINCFLFNFFAQNHGAIFYIDIIGLLVLRDNFIYNAVTFGSGVVYCISPNEETLLILSNTKFIKCFAKKYGSILYHYSIALVKLSDIIIEESENIAFYFVSSYLIPVDMRDISIKRSVSISSMIIAIGVMINGKGILISNVRAKQSIFSVEEGTFHFENVTLHNFTCSFNFIIENSVFGLKYSNSQNFEPETGFINAFDSKVDLNEIMVTNLHVNSSSLFEINGGGLNVKSIILKNNDGRIFNLKNCDLNISNLLSRNDYLVIKFQLIFYEKIDNKPFNVFLTDIYIDSILNLDVWIYFFGTLNIQILRSFFLNSGIDENSGLVLINSNSIEISFCILVNFKKGSIFCSVIERNIVSSCSIKNCSFLRNQAPAGGAIYLLDIFYIEITASFFSNNSAIFFHSIESKGEEGYGGSIFIHSIRFNLDQKVVLSKNRFLYGYADKFGFDLYSMIQTIDDETNFYEIADMRNVRRSSYPFSLKCVLKKDENDLTIIKNGIPFDLSFEIVDNFNNRMIFDNTSLFTIKSAISKTNRITIQNSISRSLMGQITFLNLIIIANINSNFSIYLSGYFDPFNNGERTVPVEKEIKFYSQNCSIGEIILANNSCFKCQAGFFSLIDPMTTETIHQSCNICPDNAQCLGGWLINPNPGYFRKNLNSESIDECLIQASCEGLIDRMYYYNESEFVNLKGGCMIGHSGNLCFTCDYQFGRYDKTEPCKACETIESSVYFRFIIYISFILGVLVLNAFSAEKSKGGSQEISINSLNKFVVDHSQQLGIIIISANFSFGFDIFVNFFNILDFISFSNPFALTNDCVLQRIYFEKESFILFKEMLIVSVPSIFAIFSFLLWLLSNHILGMFKILKFLKNNFSFNKQFFTQKISFFMLLSAYFFYALVLKSCFSLFDCFEMNQKGSRYLKINPDIVCWQGTHLKYLLISVPGIIIWGLSFPIFLRQILFRKKDLATLSRTLQIINSLQPSLKRTFNSRRRSISQIGNSNEKISVPYNNVKDNKNSDVIKDSMTFTFFYKEYKDGFIHWESFIFFRKFVINFIYSFHEKIYDEPKVLFMFVFLAYSIISTIKSMPYNIGIYNKLEIFSLFSIGLSVIAHLMLTSQISQIFKFILFMMSILFNGLFYFYILILLFKLFRKKTSIMKMKSFWNLEKCMIFFGLCLKKNCIPFINKKKNNLKSIPIFSGLKFTRQKKSSEE